jgi:hypothetical protein
MSVTLPVEEEKRHQAGSIGGGHIGTLAKRQENKDTQYCWDAVVHLKHEKTQK